MAEIASGQASFPPDPVTYLKHVYSIKPKEILVGALMIYWPCSALLRSGPLIYLQYINGEGDDTTHFIPNDRIVNCKSLGSKTKHRREPYNTVLSLYMPSTFIMFRVPNFTNMFS
jgi:hypothetical protein